MNSRLQFCRLPAYHLPILPLNYSISSKSSLHLRLPILGDRSMPRPHAPLGTLGLPGLFLLQWWHLHSPSFLNPSSLVRNLGGHFHLSWGQTSQYLPTIHFT